MKIALTFDDGPNTTTTKEVLAVLAEHRITGSFFLIGQNINEESEKMVKRALEMGCTIENHSYTHPDMTKLSAEQIREELAKTDERIMQITGERPVFFRPPYIAVNDVMWDTIDKPFICGIGCEDWVPEISAKERAKRILSQAKPNGIVLLHDMTGNSNTVEALRLAIPELKKQGYEFVTIRQLFAETGTKPQKGVLYSGV